MHSNWIGRAAAALLFTTLSGQGLAQQEPAPQESQESQEQASEPAATAPATDKGGAGAQTGAQEQSPFEYESSEQISEDLSVSFPVDIQDP